MERGRWRLILGSVWAWEHGLGGYGEVGFEELVGQAEKYWELAVLERREGGGSDVWGYPAADCGYEVEPAVR